MKDIKSATKDQLICMVQEYQSLLAKSKTKPIEQENTHQRELSREIKLIQKNSNSSESEQEIKRLKIKVNDYEFELKKMEEDHAEAVVKSKIEKDKEMKRLNEENIKMKNQINEDNARWEKKFEER